MFRINDPIHGVIEFPKNGLIHQLIETPEFQRLRRIKQLGTVDYVFPGATHTRFAHSIGVAYLVQKACTEILLKKKNFETIKGDLKLFNKPEQIILALTVAALLHDIGHAPFCHTLEGFFYSTEKSHETRTQEIILSKELSINKVLCDYIDANCEEELPNIKNGDTYRVIEELVSLFEENEIIKIENFQKNDFDLSIFSNIISGQVDCDKLDYIQRDNYYCGTPVRVDVDYIINNMVIDYVPYIGRKRIVYKENVIPSLEHFLLSRWVHYNQIVNNKACLAAESLLIRITRDIIGIDDTSETIERLDSNISYVIKESKTLKEFLKFDDYSYLSYIKEKLINKDNINRYIDRKLPKKDQDELSFENKEALIAKMAQFNKNKVFNKELAYKDCYAFNERRWSLLNSLLAHKNKDNQQNFDSSEDSNQLAFEAKDYIYIQTQLNNKQKLIRNIANISDIARRPIANERKLYIFSYAKGDVNEELFKR